MEVIFVGGIFVGVFSLIAFFGKKQMKLMDNEFSELAYYFDMDATIPANSMFRDYPEVNGLIQDYPTRVHVYTRGSGKHKKTYTEIEVECGNIDGRTFSIYKESAFSGVGRFFGMQDIEIGIPFFDQQFVIKSSDEHFARTLLDGRMRDDFEIAIRDLIGEMELDGKYIRYKEMMTITTPEVRKRYERLIELAIELAKRAETV